ncbi:MAG: hypothetical protein FJY43_01250 [Betaproteobacteria bacterium]|nr:hypothetical protein [Betaproteobacteria bacterium]
MKSKLAVILGITFLSLLASGCASTPPETMTVAEAHPASKPVIRPFSGVGTYGGYTYRRYE